MVWIEKFCQFCAQILILVGLGVLVVIVNMAFKLIYLAVKLVCGGF